MESKTCTQCNEKKDIEQFRKIRSRKKLGYRKHRNKCKSCESKNFKAWRLKNKKSLYKRKKMYRCSSVNHKYKQLQETAKVRNISVNLTKQQYEQIIKDRKCFYCDADFSKESGGNLNRISNKKPYSVKNVRPCCKKCNTIMSNYTKDDLKSRVYKIVKRMD